MLYWSEALEDKMRENHLRRLGHIGDSQMQQLEELIILKLKVFLRGDEDLGEFSLQQ